MWRSATEQSSLGVSETEGAAQAGALLSVNTADPDDAHKPFPAPCQLDSALIDGDRGNTAVPLPREAPGLLSFAVQPGKPREG